VTNGADLFKTYERRNFKRKQFKHPPPLRGRDSCGSRRSVGVPVGVGYLAAMSIDACLNCSLPFCDEKDARCAFVQITRASKKPSTYKAYYAVNREKEIARQAKWERENRERRNAYRRQRYRSQKEQQNGVLS
jgi:hypothetical protein